MGITATHDDAVVTAIGADKLGRIPMNEAIQELDSPGKPHAVVADAADGVGQPAGSPTSWRGSALTARWLTNDLPRQ